MQNREVNSSFFRTGSMVVDEHLWGTPELPVSVQRIREGGGSLDLVCACDCIYDEALGEPLLKSLEHLTQPTTTVYVGNDQSVGRCWKAPDGGWVPAYDAFFKLAERSFTIERVSTSHLPQGYDRENVALFRLAKKQNTEH